MTHLFVWRHPTGVNYATDASNSNKKRAHDGQNEFKYVRQRAAHTCSTHHDPQISSTDNVSRLS